jgi:hypothetical protein
MKSNYSNILIAAMLILMASTARVVNTEMHLYNLAPLAALGLFSGAVVKDKRYAFMLPLLGQLLADVYFQLFTNVQGFYGISQLFTYAGLAAATMLGSYMKNLKALNVAAYTLGASTLFFLISNFGTFLTGYYGHGMSALQTTYVMAIPFFKYTVEGDMAGSILLFGTYYLLQQAMLKKMQKAKA